VTIAGSRLNLKRRITYARDTPNIRGRESQYSIEFIKNVRGVKNGAYDIYDIMDTEIEETYDIWLPVTYGIMSEPV
jgi:hypothetical protein